MKPMDIDACRALVAMYGGAPEHRPYSPMVRPYDTVVHPLQAWIESVPNPWQSIQIDKCFIRPQHNLDGSESRERWDEAWAQAIYNALWY